jgi:hypothetical protein
MFTNYFLYAVVALILVVVVVVVQGTNAYGQEQEEQQQKELEQILNKTAEIALEEDKQKQEKKLIQLAKETNKVILRDLDRCYPLLDDFIKDEAKLQDCDLTLLNTKTYCDFRITNVTRENTPACEDKKVAEYFKVRKQIF